MLIETVRFEYINSSWGGSFKYKWFEQEPIDLQIANKVKYSRLR